MGRKVTAADIQVEIAKGAFRPHTALSNMALSYFQSDKNYFARTIFPMCPVSLSADNYYIFSKEDLLRDSWKRKPAYGKVEPAVLGENGQTYACQVDQMIVGIDQIRQTDLIRRQGPSIRDPRQQRTRMIANVIIQDERRQADIEYVAKKYGIDTNNPAMREAAEVTAVRSREAMEMGRTQRRYY